MTPLTDLILARVAFDQPPRVEHQTANYDDSYDAGAEYENARLMPLIKDLCAQIECLRAALEHTQDFCLCKRFKTEGFDYGENHKYRGKPGAGKRWLTPKDKLTFALARHNEFVERLAADGGETPLSGSGVERMGEK